MTATAFSARMRSSPPSCSRNVTDLGMIESEKMQLHWIRTKLYVSFLLVTASITAPQLQTSETRNISENITLKV